MHSLGEANEEEMRQIAANDLIQLRSVIQQGELQSLSSERPQMNNGPPSVSALIHSLGEADEEEMRQIAFNHVIQRRSIVQQGELQSLSNERRIVLSLARVYEDDFDELSMRSFQIFAVILSCLDFFLFGFCHVLVNGDFQGM